MMRLGVLLLLVMGILKATPLHLTPKQAAFIAQKVWLNEGAGLDKYLIHWNRGEGFASVGIGHFIWFAKGHTERFREVFPLVVASMERQGVAMPSWLTSHTPLPWRSRTQLLYAKKHQTPRYQELLRFLKRTKAYQAEFMAIRLTQALPQMLQTLNDPVQQRRLQERFEGVLYHPDGRINPQGLYVLLDYTNFKGEGTLKSERYHGEGWGLLQVLLAMDPHESNRCKAFALSAQRILARRIRNSPPQRGEERWRKGWNVRLRTYWK